MAEAIRSISENVANGLGGEGATYMADSFIDILHPPKEPTETADDIIDRITQKLREYE